MSNRRSSLIWGAILHACIVVSIASAEDPVEILYDHREDTWKIENAACSVAKLNYDAVGVPVFKLPPGVEVRIGVTNTNPMLYRAARGELTVSELESRAQLKSLIALLGKTLPLFAADGAVRLLVSPSGDADPGVVHFMDGPADPAIPPALPASGLGKYADKLKTRIDGTTELMNVTRCEHQRLKEATNTLVSWMQAVEAGDVEPDTGCDALSDPITRCDGRDPGQGNNQEGLMTFADVYAPMDHDRIDDTIKNLYALASSDMKDAEIPGVRAELVRVWGIESMTVRDDGFRGVINLLVGVCPRKGGAEMRSWRNANASGIKNLMALKSLRSKQLEILPKVIELQDGMTKGRAALKAVCARWQAYDRANGRLWLKGPNLSVKSGKKLDGSVSIAQETEFEDHVYAILGERESLPFRLQANDPLDLRINVAMVMTGHHQIGWGGFEGKDEQGEPVLMLGEKTEEQISGELALVGSFPFCKVLGLKEKSGSQLRLAAGVYLDDDAPGFLLGMEYDLVDWLNLGYGRSFRRMTVLRPGLETVTFENGLPVANSGTTIAGEDEIRTKTDFQDEWYWSVSVRIDGIPLFSKGE